MRAVAALFPSNIDWGWQRQSNCQDRCVPKYNLGTRQAVRLPYNSRRVGSCRATASVADFLVPKLHLGTHRSR